MERGSMEKIWEEPSDFHSSRVEMPSTILGEIEKLRNNWFFSHAKKNYNGCKSRISHQKSQIQATYLLGPSGDVNISPFQHKEMVIAKFQPSKPQKPVTCKPRVFPAVLLFFSEKNNTNARHRWNGTSRSIAHSSCPSNNPHGVLFLLRSLEFGHWEKTQTVNISLPFLGVN